MWQKDIESYLKKTLIVLKYIKEYYKIRNLRDKEKS